MQTGASYTSKLIASICISLLAVNAQSAGSNTRVEVPFIDGMTITTSNSVANVEVRAQSFGPGFCSVIFNASPGGSDKQIAAPPGTYSGWIVLVSHIGSATFKISNRVECDTGVLAQVRYYK